MRRPFVIEIAACMTVAMLMSLGIGVQEGQTQPPPVTAPIVREGELAMKLAEALKLGQPLSETEAESMLGSAGIAPRNGWIADYPVTPDIVGELRDSVGYAAQAKTISMDRDSALQTLENVQTSLNISVEPAPAGQTYPPEETPEVSAGGYPDQTIINNSYYDMQEPPIVTYYSPPPDYYSLYSWVPYPFWWSGFWFGGFYILHDFHRHFREHGHVRSVSNHFNDIRANRAFRVDPVNRFRGRTYSGIGAPRSHNSISTGVRRAPERIFNWGPNRSFAPSSNTKSVVPQGRGEGHGTQQSTGRFRTVNPFPANRVYSHPPGAGRTFKPHSNTPGSGRTSHAPGRGGRGTGRGTRR